MQRQDLAETVRVRRAIAVELRRFLTGESADKDKVLSVSKRYGELDGETSYLYATAFAQIGQTLTAQQQERLARMRTASPSDPKGPFLYSTPIPIPKIENTASLFGVRRAGLESHSPRALRNKGNQPQGTGGCDTTALCSARPPPVPGEGGQELQLS